MARLQTFLMSAATGDTETDSVNLGEGEFTRFCVYFPDSPLNAAADVYFQGSLDSGTTWHTIGYSKNPATITSGFVPVDPSRDCWGSAVICEAAAFATDFRVKWATVTTNAATIKMVAGKD